MKHGTLKLSSLAAAVALACGIASAQQDAEREGVQVPQRIESTDSARQESDQSVSGQQDQQDRSALERSAIGEDPAEEAGDEARDPGLGDLSDSASDADESRSVASGDTQDDQSEAQSASSSGDPSQLDQVVEEHDNLGKFVEAIKAAGLADSLTGDTAYTIFAPTDEAFESAEEDWMAPENRDRLVAMLRAHIVADDVDQETAKTLQAAQTIDGGTVQLTSEGEEWMVAGAKIVEPDIQAGNLTIHAIDTVLSGTTQIAAAEPGLERDEADDESSVSGLESGVEGPEAGQEPSGLDLEEEAESESGVDEFGADDTESSLESAPELGGSRRE